MSGEFGSSTEVISEEEFARQWRKRQRNVQGVIALKGLPFTCKTLISDCLGKALMCPVLYLEDFLLNKQEEEDAFATLCRVARHLMHSSSYSADSKFGCVIIKSRLDATFHLDQLRKLCFERSSLINYLPLVIVECKVKSCYLWKKRFNEIIMAGGDDDWHGHGHGPRPRAWDDMEKAMDEYVAQSQAWDQHLDQTMPKASRGMSTPPVRRMIVDPHTDLSFIPYAIFTDAFIDAVKYLLTTRHQRWSRVDPYVVEFDDLRRSLFDEKLSVAAASLEAKSKYLCPQGGCVFMYSNASSSASSSCRACDEKISTAAYYSCYFCELALHKKCAEWMDWSNFQGLKPAYDDELFDFDIYFGFPEKHVSKSCLDIGQPFSMVCESCIFQTYIKCGMTPAIISHNGHPHFLSIQFRFPLSMYQCKACRLPGGLHSYGCNRCASSYHLYCATLPLEVSHAHGGYEHVMKLVYSREGSEEEEEYWCDHCYRDMDPQAWFYACQECPYYAIHMHCLDWFVSYENNNYVRFVDQIQSQMKHGRENGRPSLEVVGPEVSITR